MPLYTFSCPSCGSSEQRYASIATKSLACTCGQEKIRLPPSNIMKPNVKELVDPYSGVHLSPDYKEEINQRSLDHYWSVMVPRFCQEYSPEECIAQGWAYLSEKGEFCVHTKPPNRR